ncbi:hypothetical protein H1C71_031224, partial [Ictidomys tridecemlineatus]
SRAHSDAVLCSSRTQAGPRYTLDTPPTAGRCPPPLPDHRTASRSAHTPVLRCAAMAFHHTHRQTAAPSDLDSPWRYLSWPQPVDIDSHSWLPPPPPQKGPASLSSSAHPIPSLLPETSCVPGSQMESLIFSCGPLSFPQNPVFF